MTSQVRTGPHLGASVRVRPALWGFSVTRRTDAGLRVTLLVTCASAASLANGLISAVVKLQSYSLIWSTRSRLFTVY